MFLKIIIPFILAEYLRPDPRSFPSLDMAHLPLLGFAETFSKYAVSVRWEHI